VLPSSPKNETAKKKLRRASTKAINSGRMLRRRHSYQSGDAARISHEDGDSPKKPENVVPRRRSFMADVLEDANVPKMADRDDHFVNLHKIRQVYSHARHSVDGTNDEEKPRRRSFQDTALAVRKSVASTRRSIQATEVLMTISHTKRCERMARQHFLELTRTSMDEEGVMDFHQLSELLGVIHRDIGEIESARPELDFESLKGRVTKAQFEAQNLHKAKDDVNRYTRELQFYLDNGLAETKREELKSKVAAAQKASSMFIRSTWDMRRCFYDCGMLDGRNDDGTDFISGIVQEIRGLPEQELRSLKNACLHDPTDSNAIQEVTLLNITRLGMKLDKLAVHKVVGELRRVFWEAEVDSEFGSFMTQQQEMLNSLESVIREVKKVKLTSTSDAGREESRGSVPSDTRHSPLAEYENQGPEGIDEAIESNQESCRTAVTVDATHNMNTDLAEVSDGKAPKVTDQDSCRNRAQFVERRLKRRVTTGMLHTLMTDMVTGDLRIDYASSWSLRDRRITGMLFGEGDGSEGSGPSRRRKGSSASGRSIHRMDQRNGHAGLGSRDEATLNRRTFPAAPRDAESKALVAVSMSLTLDDPTTERRVARIARRRATSHHPGRARTLQSNGSDGSSASGSPMGSPLKWRSHEGVASPATTWQPFTFPSLPSAVKTLSASPRPGSTGEDVPCGHSPQGPSPSQRASVRLPSLRQSMMSRPKTVSTEIVLKDHDQMQQRWQYLRMQRQRACGRTVASVAWLRDAREPCADKMLVSMHLPDIRGRRSKTDGGRLSSKILLAHTMVSPGRRANTAFRRTRGRWNMLS